MEKVRSLQDRIDEMQRELGLMEAAYSKSKERVEGRDQEWEERRRALVRQMCELIGLFKIGDDATKAVAIVAQCAVMAAELRAPDLWVSKYEEKKAMLRTARAQQDAQERASENARRAYEESEWGGRRASNL
jgi:hypothetical protein